MKFYTKFNPPPSIGADISSESMACQEFKEECDINNIVKKPNYGINPLNPPKIQPMFGDFTDINLQDFYEAQNTMAEATQLFEQLDSKIRERFNNDPVKLIEFVNNKDNIEEGVRLGILEYVNEPDVKTPEKKDTSKMDVSPQTQVSEANPVVPD